MEPFVSTPLKLAQHGQADFAISPPASRSYEFATFGSGDTVAVMYW